MPSTKCEGLSYRTNILKSRGSVIWNNFLNTDLDEPHFLYNEMILCIFCYK